MTPKRREALEWILEREPVSWFGAGGPSLQYVKRLVREGDVESIAPAQRVGMVTHRLTTKGRAHLEGIHAYRVIKEAMGGSR